MKIQQKREENKKVASAEGIVDGIMSSGSGFGSSFSKFFLGVEHF